MEEVKFFIYARKSTRSDDRQALSIPAQLRALNKLATDQGLRIVGRIIERDSAHTPGRPQFNGMMQRINAGEAAGIIAWHPDRLARNSKDGGEIIYFLDIGLLVDIKFSTFWFENTPQGKSNLGHEFVQTKQFSDKLSADTERGLLEKAESGHFPGKAPRGYLNNRATKRIVIDPHLAPIVKTAFESFSEGNLTIEDMQRQFASHGIVTKRTKRWRCKGGDFVHREFIRRFLRNPFYYGHFKFAGELYEGKHPPIITKQLFDKVQSVLARRGHQKAPRKEPKPFTKLLRCGECGMMITAEKQKGFVYYRCSKQSQAIACLQPYVREEALNRELSQVIAQCAMPEDMATLMLNRIDVEMRESARTAERVLREKRAALAETGAKQQKLLDAYLDAVIDRDTFTERKQQLLSEKKHLQEQIIACEADDKAWLEPFKEWVLTAKTLGKVAFTASPQEKRTLALSIFGSNLTLLGKKASGKAVKQWSLLQNLPHNSSAVRCYEATRTTFLENRPICEG